MHGRHRSVAHLQRTREQSALNEMWILRCLLNRFHDATTDVFAYETLRPNRRGVFSDNRCYTTLGRRRIDMIVTQRFLQTNQFAKILPEFLFQRRGGDEFIIGGAINLIARAATGDQAAAGFRPFARGKSFAHGPIQKCKHVVAHRHIDLAAFAGLVALSQREQHIHHGGISTAGNVGN